MEINTQIVIKFRQRIRFGRKNEYCLNILNQWKYWCFHPSEIVTDAKSIHEEYDEYDAHRHDQSILTTYFIIFKRL